MKLAILALLFSVSTGAFAFNQFPNGHWEGSGSSVLETGQKVPYYFEVTMRNNFIEVFTDTGSSSDTVTIRVAFRGNGFFRGTRVSLATGKSLPVEGYCALTECHMSIGADRERTFGVHHGDYSEMGSSRDFSGEGGSARYWWYQNVLVSVEDGERRRAGRVSEAKSEIGCR